MRRCRTLNQLVPRISTCFHGLLLEFPKILSISFYLAPSFLGQKLSPVSAGAADLPKHHGQLHRDLHQPLVPKTMVRCGKTWEDLVRWWTFKVSETQKRGSPGTKYPWPEKRRVMLMEAEGMWIRMLMDADFFLEISSAEFKVCRS